MELVIRAIYCCLVYVSYSFTSGEFVDMTYSTNFVNATLICNQNGGKLATPGKWTTTDRNGTERVWTPKVFLRTPFIASKGCYKNLITNGSNNVGKGDSSVAKCFAHCHPLKIFALGVRIRKQAFILEYGDFFPKGLDIDCLCCDLGNYAPRYDSQIKKNMIKEEKIANASFCNGSSVNNNTFKRVYEVLSDPDGVQGDDEEDDVYKVFKCRYRGGFPRISPTSLGESMFKEAGTFYPICKTQVNGEVLSENTAYTSWKEAEAACIRRNEMYMSYKLHSGHCQQLSRYVNNLYLKASFWCDERTYSAVIPYHDLDEENIPWKNVRCTVATYPYNLKYVSCDDKGYKFACDIEKDNAFKKNSAKVDAAPELITIIVVVLVCLFACGIIICVSIFYIKKMKHQREERKDNDKPLQAPREFINIFAQHVRLILNFLRRGNDIVEPNAKGNSFVDLECGNANLREAEVQNHVTVIEEKHLVTKGKDTEHCRSSVTEVIEPFLPESKPTMKNAENGENSKLISTMPVDDRKTEEGKETLEVAVLELNNADGDEWRSYESKLSYPSLNDTNSNSIDKSPYTQVGMCKGKQNGIRSNIYVPKQIIDMTSTYLYSNRG